MRLRGSDWLLLRWNMLAIGASAFIGAAILYHSGNHVDDAQKEWRNAQSLLDEARHRLAAAHQDQENLTMYAGQYAALIEQKIIGDEPRLDWVEGLESLRRKKLVADFRYNIAPQKRYLPQPPIDSGNFDIHYSEMKLQFDLLHEGQLLNFFAALRADIKGWYQLEGCTLQRHTTIAESGGKGSTRIKAECSGGWVTLKNRNLPQ